MLTSNDTLEIYGQLVAMTQQQRLEFMRQLSEDRQLARLTYTNSAAREYMRRRQKALDLYYDNKVIYNR